MEKQTKKLDSGFVVHWQVMSNDKLVNSLIFEIEQSEGNSVLGGQIRWDGCSYWWPSDDYHSFHLCGIGMLADLTEAMGECYNIARKHMPEAYGN